MRRGRGVGVDRAAPAPGRGRRSTTGRRRCWRSTKPWWVSVISTGPIWRTIRFDSRSTTSTTRGSLSHCCRPVGGERRRLDVGELDRAPLGLRHDLRRDDDDVAVGQIDRGAAISAGEVVAAARSRAGPATGEDRQARRHAGTGTASRAATVGARCIRHWGNMADETRLRDLRPVGRGPRSPASTSPTSPTTGRVDVGHGAHRVRPARGPQRVPAAHRRRAVHRARPRPHVDRRRLRAAHRQRARRPRTAAGRSAPAATSASAARTATSTPSGETRRTRSTRPGRSAAHPRGAAADPVHAQGRDLRRARLGGRRRAQPARRVRPHARQRRARPVQADRRRRGQLRRRLRFGVPGPPGRPEVRPRDLLPRPRVHRRSRCTDGRRQRGRAARRARGDGAGVGRARSTPRARPRSGC